MRSKFFSHDGAAGALLLLCVAHSPVQSEDFWQRTGGPTGGEIGRLVAVNGDALFTLTGELRRSLDDGFTWDSIAIPFPFQTVSSAPDGALWGMGASQLAVTMNLGTTWSTLARPPELRWLRCLADGMYAVTTSGLEVSHDGGVHWASLLHHNSVIDVVRGHEGTLYVSTNESLLQSGDEGATWAVATPLDGPATLTPRLQGGVWLGGTAYADYGIVVGGLRQWNGTNLSPVLLFESVGDIVVRPSGRVFAACSGRCQYTGCYGGGVYYSDDAGAHWQVAGLTGYAITGLVQRSNTALFAATSGLSVDYGFAPAAGVWRTSGPGTQWNPVNRGLGYARSVNVAAAPGIVYAADGAQLHWTTDHGLSWNSHALPFDFRELTLKTTPDGGALVQSVYSCLLSRDHGTTWKSLYPPRLSVLRAVAATPQGFILAGGSGGLSGSTNDGESWGYADAFPSGDPVIAIEPGTRQRIFVITSSEIFVTGDLGVSWQRVGGYLPVLSILNPVPVAVAGDERALYTADHGGVHLWTEAAGTWQHQQLPSAPDRLSDMLLAPDGFLYAVGWRVSRLAPGAAAWEPVDGVPVSRSFFDANPQLALDRAGFLYCGTTNDGVFRSSRSLSAASDVAGVTFIAMGAPTPNPFRSRTAFAVHAAPGTRARLSVFDARGRRADAQWFTIAPGNSALEWIAPPQLRGGVYYYELRTGERMQRGRMTLVR